jgi:PAS domain S-box-containing protein
LRSSMPEYPGRDERVLLLLPKTLDAESMGPVLDKAGVTSRMCATPEELCAEIETGAGALLLAEELLYPLLVSCLKDALENQPSWSELPILVLLRPGSETQWTQNTLLLPGEVILVERPVRVNTFVAYVHAALRSRRRQYLVRDQMQELARSERRYRTLFNSIDEAFCVVKVLFDEQGKPIDLIFLETNPSFEKHTGITDAPGRRMRELAPKHEEHWFETYGRVALTGEPIRFHYRAAEFDRWYDVYAFRYGDPEAREVATVFTDITETKQSVQEIERLNASLEAQVSELKETNLELDAFNRMVSHDLRQPLNSIGLSVQMVEMLCAQNLDDECMDYVRSIHHRVNRMNELISTLLKFSSSTRSELQRKSLDLTELARDVASELRLNEPKRAVTFIIAEKLPANGDPTLLRAVMENLIGNAWKYTGVREEAVIEIGKTEIEGEEAFFVRDNGKGFDMATAGEVFSPFKRLPGADQFRGFGIGLATVDKIIRRHGGRIWADAEPEKGATFYFTLPVDGIQE